MLHYLPVDHREIIESNYLLYQMYEKIENKAESLRYYEKYIRFGKDTFPFYQKIGFILNFIDLSIEIGNFDKAKSLLFEFNKFKEPNF